MADPSMTATSGAAYVPPPYVPNDYGDYATYQPQAKTAWAKDGSDEKGLTFADFLDAINPLQHIPVVAQIYRAITGEKIGLAAKLVGDTLYGGGPIAFLASGISSAFEGAAGKSTSEMLASIAQDVFGSSSSKSGDAPASTQEARAHDSEQAHEDELGALTQMAMANVAPAAAPQTASIAQSDAATATVPTIAPVAAPAPKPVAAPQDKGDEASARIAKTVAEAQRAQAGLLLASVQQPESSTTRAKRRDDEPKQIAEAKPASATNPYLAPERSDANWSNESLADTIARYERAVAANRR
jgi:hypothetical protein